MVNKLSGWISAKVNDSRLFRPVGGHWITVKNIPKLILLTKAPLIFERNTTFAALD
jgi:hypothetical protein